MDRDRIETLSRQADTLFARPKHPWVGSGYGGEDRDEDRAGKKLGWSVEILKRPRKPAAKCVLAALAEQCSHDGVLIGLEKPLPPKEFVVLPRR